MKNMWAVFAVLSAVFAALTSILAKVGIKDVDSNLATAIRTVVVVAMSWLMVFITNAQSGITNISKKSWIFLILSGLATGASWLCYYKAIQIGEVSKVVPIDKSSTVLTIKRRNHSCFGIYISSRGLQYQVTCRLYFDCGRHTDYGSLNSSLALNSFKGVFF